MSNAARSAHTPSSPITPAATGTDRPPACAHDRARRRLLARWQELDLVPAALLAVSGCAVSLVPRVVPGQAPCRLSGGCAAVLRQAYPTDRSASVRRLSGAAVDHKVGGLLQAPLRRPEASLALSRPLHSSRRHLKSPLDRRP